MKLLALKLSWDGVLLPKLSDELDYALKALLWEVGTRRVFSHIPSPDSRIFYIVSTGNKTMKRI